LASVISQTCELTEKSYCLQYYIIIKMHDDLNFLDLIVPCHFLVRYRNYKGENNQKFFFSVL